MGIVECIRITSAGNSYKKIMLSETSLTLTWYYQKNLFAPSDSNFKPTNNKDTEINPRFVLANNKTCHITGDKLLNNEHFRNKPNVCSCK